MARYNSISSTSSVAGGSTISTPASGLLTTLTGSGTVTIPNPVLYTGQTQTFYNSTASAITLSTPSGNFIAPGIASASSISIPAGSIFTAISDGANYLAQDWLGCTVSTTNLVATGGTIDGINIGATTTGTGKFSTLNVTSTTTLAGMTATTGAFSGISTFTNNAAATLGTTSTGAVQVTGGASVAGILNVGGKSYFGDSVGIGTNNPGSILLDIAGTNNIRHTYTGANGGILFGQYNTTGDAQIQNQSTGGATVLATNNTERMRIDSSGNVGIGISSGIGAKLEVKGSASDNATFNLNNNSGNIWKFWNDNGASGLNIQYNGTTKIIADINANVGIGTTVMNVYDAVASNRPLVVAKSDSSTSNIGNTASITISNLDTTTSNVSQINFAAITGANTSHFSSAIISAIHGARTNGQYPAGILTFSTSTALNNAPSEKMRIDSAGNVKLSLAGTKILNSSGNPILLQSGSVLQVVTNYPSSGAVYTQAVSSYAEISSAYRTSITPISTNSILILEWVGLIGGANSSSISTMKFYDVTNNADVGLSGLSLGSRGIGHGSFRQVDTDVNDRDNIILRVVVPNSSTTARTYSLYHYSESSVTKYFNATGTDNNGCSYVKWHFIIKEIAA